VTSPIPASLGKLALVRRCFLVSEMLMHQLSRRSVCSEESSSALHRTEAGIESPLARLRSGVIAEHWRMRGRRTI
jgi:hypothetical protein